MVWRGERQGDAELDEQHVEQAHFLAPDENEGETVRSIFAAGWFRATLVLTTLAVVFMLALPHLLDWYESATSSVTEPVSAKHATRPASTPASPPMSRATRPRPGPVPLVSAAAPTPTQEKLAMRAMPALPPRSEPRALSSGATARPVQMVGAAGNAQEITASPKTSVGSEGSGRYWVQLGFFKDLKNAERFAESVREQGFPVHVASVTRTPPDTTAAGTHYLVRAGAFSDQARAAAVRDDLKSRGYAGFLTDGAAR